MVYFNVSFAFHYMIYNIIVFPGPASSIKAYHAHKGFLNWKFVCQSIVCFYTVKAIDKYAKLLSFYKFPFIRKYKYL